MRNSLDERTDGMVRNADRSVLNIDESVKLAPARGEKGFLYPSDLESISSKNMKGYLPELRDTLCLPMSVIGFAPKSEMVKVIDGLKDDNRCLILPQYNVTISGRRYYLDVKGFGARAPMYGFMMPESEKHLWSSRFSGGGIEEHWKTITTGDSQYTSELWFGNGPYGAHGTRESMDSISVTELCTSKESPNCLNGFWICPVLCSTPIPEWIVKGSENHYWYRKYRGSWSQQLRLIPGNIRLYFHSDCTLGISPQKVFSIYGVESVDQIDKFIENYIQSGIAALTLAARTCRITEAGYEVLDYDDVWLDKDSIIAPDGILHFADIDDLEWRQYQDQQGVKRKSRRQFERNFFEFMFGLDAMLSDAYLLGEMPMTPEKRRLDVAARIEMALMTDDFVSVDHHKDGLDIEIGVPGMIDEPEVVRMIDLNSRRIEGR